MTRTAVLNLEQLLEHAIVHLLRHRRQMQGGGDTPEAIMTALVRAITYATLFIGLVLVYLPAQVLSVAGVTRPARLGAPQLTGMVVGAAGAALAIWCILSFALVGRGTPAPFDPPRRLVVRGPYSYVRNPMYLGASLALTGAALFYETVVLWAYAGGFLLLMHFVVVGYEEPALQRTFGEDYEKYCQQVNRWLPRPYKYRPEGRANQPPNDIRIRAAR